MSKTDFFYSSLYGSIEIDKHIERYAPRNRFNKLEFEKTSKQERVDLFKGVVTAIHNHGEGLDTLAYIRQSDQQSVQLFTEAEVIHLQDVANLLDKLKPVVLALTLLWFVLVFWMIFKRIKLASGSQFTIYALILLVSVGLVLALGPEKVFNQLHIWVFPDDHQWYFFYEDSLMSTMMHAPDLFAYIAAIWSVFSIILTIFLLKIVHLIQSTKR